MMVLTEISQQARMYPSVLSSLKGLGIIRLKDPPLKRWAIFFRPPGCPLLTI